MTAIQQEVHTAQIEAIKELIEMYEGLTAEYINEHWQSFPKIKNGIATEQTQSDFLSSLTGWGTKDTCGVCAAIGDSYETDVENKQWICNYCIWGAKYKQPCYEQPSYKGIKTALSVALEAGKPENIGENLRTAYTIRAKYLKTVLAELI